MAVGILALQGAVEPHISHIENLGQSAVKVRSAADLQEIERLILPGGESSTMLNLMQRHELMEPLREFGRRRPIWGVCAGAILLANEVVSPKQPSLKLMAIRATRNFYGSQLNSFKKEVSIEPLGIDVKADFIRAPKLERLSSNVELLGKAGEQEVLLKEGHLLASAFHTELGEDSGLHAYFLTL